MPLFRVQLRMAINRPDLGQVYKWSNLYFGEVADAADGVAKGVSWWSVLRSCHNENAFCYAVYASDLVPATTNYLIGSVPEELQLGTLTGSGGFLPPFNVARVDLAVASSRPSRKFLRVPLQEGDITLGQLTGAIVDAIDDTFTDLLALTDAPVDESGNAFVGALTLGVTSRRLGKFAFTAVPSPPA